MTREELNQRKQKSISLQVRRGRQRKILKFFFKILLVFFVLIGVFFLLNKYVFTSRIIFKEERIINEKIPYSFNGLKIIHFSDLHYGTTVFVDEVNSLVKSINIRKPDLVVFTGDLIDKNYDLKSDEQERLITQLSKIDASIGKYAVTGEEDGENFGTIFNQSGFIILDNEYDLVYNDSDKPILLIGISSLLSDQNDVDKAFSYFTGEAYNSNIYTIAIMHEPDLVDQIDNSYSADLYLAGHSHNNSINYPWGDSPYQIDGALKYNEAHYVLENAELFVSSGIGTNRYGIRFLSMPSANFFRLTSEE